MIDEEFTREAPTVPIVNQTLDEINADWLEQVRRESEAEAERIELLWRSVQPTRNIRGPK